MYLLLTRKKDKVGIHSIATITVDSAGLKKFAEEAFDILEELHTRGMLHNDITPNHLMFDRFGSMFLIDFGAATPIGHPTKFSTDKYSSVDTYTGVNV